MFIEVAGDVRVSREQLVGPVVYGQHVLEEPASPEPGGPVPAAAGSDTPSGAPPAAPAAAGDGQPSGETGPADAAFVASGVAGVSSVTVVVDADGVPDAVVTGDAEADSGKFTVRLDNFTGPFDLLLQLIGKHKLDVTEVALHQVTDDFIAYIRGMGDDWDLGEASEFLLVAATLLDLKAARLLPAAEVEDEEDLALLEARDLLFARLLQYKAYKEAAAHIAELELTGGRRWPRLVQLEQRYAEALPELVLGVGPERLLKLALKSFVPKPGPPQVSIAHIHQVRVSVREHAALIRERLRRAGTAAFSLLVADCENTLEVVARFLALLELYRENLVDFTQPTALDELTVIWIGGDNTGGDIEIDDYEGTPPKEEEPPPAASVTDADLDFDALPGDDPESDDDAEPDDDAESDDDPDLTAVTGSDDDPGPDAIARSEAGPGAHAGTDTDHEKDEA